MESPNGDGDGGEGFGVATGSAVELNAYEVAIGAAATEIDQLPYYCCVTKPPKMRTCWTMVSANVMMMMIE